MTQRSETTGQPLGQLVEVETSFHREATRAGGVSRQAAIKQVDHTFSTAQSELGQKLDAALALTVDRAATIAGAGEASPALVRQMRDGARELRDFGGLAQYPLVTAIAAMFCDILSGVVDGKIEYREDAVGCFVDALVLFKSEDKRGMTTLEAPEFLHDLARMQHRLLPAD